MNEVVYSIGDLRNIIKESSQEFKPKFGADVEKDNKEINDKSYKETEAKVEKFNGGLKAPNEEVELPLQNDGNKSTLDNTFDYDPGKDYKERVKAQAHGYTSKMEEEDGIEKSGDFEGNEEVYDDLEKAHDGRAKERITIKKSGLAARTMPDSTFDKNSMYESKKMKRLVFKHTKFLNEEHMLERIPEEYKVSGQRIMMKDAVDNEYIVEWVKDDRTGFVESNIVSYENKRIFNEQMDKMKMLMGYNSADQGYRTTKDVRINENKNVGRFINEIKKKIDE